MLRLIILPLDVPGDTPLIVLLLLLVHLTGSAVLCWATASDAGGRAGRLNFSSAKKSWAVVFCLFLGFSLCFWVFWGRRSDVVNVVVLPAACASTGGGRLDLLTSAIVVPLKAAAVVLLLLCGLAREAEEALGDGVVEGLE